MDFRPAQPDDCEAIRSIAAQSFQTSFSLSPEEIEMLVGEVFADDRVAERVESEAAFLLVAADGEGPNGFVDMGFGEEALLRWLHVEPGARGQGIGTQLFERARTAARERDLPVIARVLTTDDEGGTFCEQFGFERRDKTRLEVDGVTQYRVVYVDPDRPGRYTAANSVDIPETISDDGTTLTVDQDDGIPGTDGSFFPTYRGEPAETRYGYYCANCGSTEVGTDSLGRLECQTCGNKHLADTWDAAYL